MTRMLKFFIIDTKFGLSEGFNAVGMDKLWFHLGKSKNTAYILLRVL